LREAFCNPDEEYEKTREMIDRHRVCLWVKYSRSEEIVASADFERFELYSILTRTVPKEVGMLHVRTLVSNTARWWDRLLGGVATDKEIRLQRKLRAPFEKALRRDIAKKKRDYPASAGWIRDAMENQDPTTWFEQ
jgi:hypothetical protein